MGRCSALMEPSCGTANEQFRMDKVIAVCQKSSYNEKIGASCPQQNAETYWIDIYRCAPANKINIENMEG
jgi:hypothetical protein